MRAPSNDEFSSLQVQKIIYPSSSCLVPSQTGRTLDVSFLHPPTTAGILHLCVIFALAEEESTLSAVVALPHQKRKRKTHEKRSTVPSLAGGTAAVRVVGGGERVWRSHPPKVIGEERIWKSLRARVVAGEC